MELLTIKLSFDIKISRNYTMLYFLKADSAG